MRFTFLAASVFFLGWLTSHLILGKIAENGSVPDPPVGRLADLGLGELVPSEPEWRDTLDAYPKLDLQIIRAAYEESNAVDSPFGPKRGGAATPLARWQKRFAGGGEFKASIEAWLDQATDDIRIKVEREEIPKMVRRWVLQDPVECINYLTQNSVTGEAALLAIALDELASKGEVEQLKLGMAALFEAKSLNSFDIAYHLQSASEKHPFRILDAIAGTNPSSRVLSTVVYRCAKVNPDDLLERSGEMETGPASITIQKGALLQIARSDPARAVGLFEMVPWEQGGRLILKTSAQKLLKQSEKVAREATRNIDGERARSLLDSIFVSGGKGG